ncbi:MAG: DEAD/DEAH box helicase, partial [Pseudomonadota bacterium]
GLDYDLILGNPQQRIKAANGPCPVHVINIDNLVWLIEFWGKHWPYDMVVLDESSLFKSVGTRRFRKLKTRLDKIERMVLLTGTPAPNGMLDLWPQIFLLDNGKRLFRTFTGYKNHYFESDYMGYTWTPRPGSEEDIYEKISDLCLRLAAADYLTLPERIDNHVRVELPAAKMKQYRALERDCLLELENDETITALSAAALVNKLLQFANGAIYNEDKDWHEVHTEKLKALEEIIETANGHPVLVAYNFKSDLARLRSKFKNAEVLDKDPETIHRWNRGEIPILLAHPQSAGHGLNLQAGGHLLVWFGLTWSLEQYQQFNARLHRQGQEQGVIVHHIIAADTVDEDVMDALSRKDVTQGALLNALRDRAEERKAA